MTESSDAGSGASEPVVLTERIDGVQVVTINRPDAELRLGR